MTRPRSPLQGLLAFTLVVGAPVAYLGVTATAAAALTTINVTSNADSGPNTLRAALTAANSTADDVEIDVASGLGTVTLASGLPAYTGDGANHSLTVKGNGVSITGASAANVFDTISGYAGAETFDSLTITGGAVAINSNGVSSITLTNSTLSGGSLDGIGTTGAVSVSNSSITGRGDDAITNGGGAITVSGSALTGNGNDAIDTGGSTITVTASTLAGNTHDGIDTGGGSITVKDSTIANNTHNGIDAGGTVIQLAYVTMTGNDSGTTGSGQVDTGGASLTSFASVIAGPASGNSNCDTGGTTLTSQGYNYSDDATCGFTQPSDKQSAADPKLGALGNNGGPTATEEPLGGSPLVDAIPKASCQTGLASAVATDQRGVTRPQGAGCDIGAVEVTVAAPHVYAQGTNGHLIRYLNDGLTGRTWNAYDLSAAAGGGSSITGTLDAFTYGSTEHVYVQGPGGHLFDYVADGTNGHTWNAYDVTANAGGFAPIASTPDAFLYGGRLHVYAQGTNGHLVEYVNDGLNGRTWNAYDLSAASGGALIASTPDAFLIGSTIHVYTQGANGDLVEIANDLQGGRIWNGYDLTAVAGGTAPITGTPDAFSFAGTRVEAHGANGDLIEYDPDGLHGRAWNAYDLSVAAGAGHVGGQPDAVDYGGTAHVYVQGAGHLMDYTPDFLNGRVWNAYDVTTAAGGTAPIASVPSSLPLGTLLHVYSLGMASNLLEYVNDGLNGRLWNAYDLTADSGGTAAIATAPDASGS